jgi:integrase
MRITDLRRVHVSRPHASISSTAPGAANRAASLVSAIWNWAARRDEVSFEKNPARGVERNREQGKERYPTAAGLGYLGDALRLAETDGLPWEPDKTKPTAKHAPKPDNRRTLADPFAVAAIRLLIMTGARLREILHAEWRDLDNERGMIHLPDSKTGRKPIYLSAAALAVRNGLPRVADNPFIIPGAKKGSPRADLKKPWAAVRAHTGLEGVRIHDLRHSFASIGAGSGMGLPLLGRLPQATRHNAKVRSSRRRPLAEGGQFDRRDDRRGYEGRPRRPRSRRASEETRVIELDAAGAESRHRAQGVRLREILDTQWPQLDLESVVLFLPGSKTGKKPLYLSAAAQSVLADIPGSRTTRIISLALRGELRAPICIVLGKRFGSRASRRVRVHDLRHSFASFSAGASPFASPSLGSC